MLLQKNNPPPTPSTHPTGLSLAGMEPAGPNQPDLKLGKAFPSHQQHTHPREPPHHLLTGVEGLS